MIGSIEYEKNLAYNNLILLGIKIIYNFQTTQAKKLTR